MRKLILFLAVYGNTLMATQPSLIRGTPATPLSFPEAVYIRNNHGDRCSSTVVGKKVLLTAAHCVEDSKVINPVDTAKHDFTAVCDPHIKYEGEDFDMALCLSDTPLDVTPATLADRGPRMGELVLLSGYGCTSSRRKGGNDGIFRIGFSRVDNLTGADNTFFTRSETTLCSGDSGGAAYLNSEDMDNHMHYIYGVNARTDFESLSIMQAVYTDEAKHFFTNWSKRRKAKICGLNTLCDRPKRPGNPPPPDIDV